MVDVDDAEVVVDDGGGVGEVAEVGGGDGEGLWVVGHVANICSGGGVVIGGFPTFG